MSNIRKGDKVLVIAGKERNKVGVVEAVFPQKNRIVISGLNIVKKHLRKSTSNPQGGIIEKSAPFHISNVMILDESEKPTRVGYRIVGDVKERIAKRTNEVITKPERK